MTLTNLKLFFFHPLSGYDCGLALKRYENGDSVRYIVVDTAGQERYTYVLPSYMRDCDAVVVVYDVSVRVRREGERER